MIESIELVPLRKEIKKAKNKTVKAIAKCFGCNKGHNDST
jgi:hypothetical protein